MVRWLNNENYDNTRKSNYLRLVLYLSYTIIVFYDYVQVQGGKAYFDIENTGETWKATINKGIAIKYILVLLK
jgi:hypothetical protein